MKINIHFTLAVIAILLSGGISVSSHDDDLLFSPVKHYPFKIALTFDDGPHPGFTGRIISVLSKEKIHATFFAVGSRMSEYPYLARYIVKEGNELAGHTFTHRNLTRLSKEEIVRELESTRTMIKSISGTDCRLFRPPGGRYNKGVVSISERLGYSMVLWTVFPKDHDENNPDVIIKKVLAQATDGGIVLLHSGRDATIAALPEIIHSLRRRGFRFVTVSELVLCKVNY